MCLVRNRISQRWTEWKWSKEKSNLQVKHRNSWFVLLKLILGLGISKGTCESLRKWIPGSIFIWKLVSGIPRKYLWDIGKHPNCTHRKRVDFRIMFSSNKDKQIIWKFLFISGLTDQTQLNDTNRRRCPGTGEQLEEAQEEEVEAVATMVATAANHSIKCFKLWSRQSWVTGWLSMSITWGAWKLNPQWRHWSSLPGRMWPSEYCSVNFHCQLASATQTTTDTHPVAVVN